MFLRGVRRLRVPLSQTVTRSGGEMPAGSGTPEIPDVFCKFGNQNSIFFLSHPGVLSLSTLLDMPGIVQMKANFTQEDSDEIKKYDVELGHQAEIAAKNQVPISWQDLPHVEQEMGHHLAEQEVLAQCRQQVLAAEPGDYTLPDLDYSLVHPCPSPAKV